jgi:hypothetical protein
MELECSALVVSVDRPDDRSTRLELKQANWIISAAVVVALCRFGITRRDSMTRTLESGQTLPVHWTSLQPTAKHAQRS